MVLLSFSMGPPPMNVYVILMYIFKNANTQYELNTVSQYRTIFEFCNSHFIFSINIKPFVIFYVVPTIHQGKYIGKESYFNASYRRCQNKYQLDGSELPNNC